MSGGPYRTLLPPPPLPRAPWWQRLAPRPWPLVVVAGGTPIGLAMGNSLVASVACSAIGYGVARLVLGPPPWRSL